MPAAALRRMDHRGEHQEDGRRQQQHSERCRGVGAVVSKGEDR
jgi:hypothetical protein